MELANRLRSNRLSAHLSEHGHDVLCVRDPGTSEIGSRLRALLLDSDLEMHRRTEAMLFMASRCEMIECDDSTGIWRETDGDLGSLPVVNRRLPKHRWQCVGRETLWEIGRLANDGIEPELTILLDMPATEAIKRMKRPADRMEQRGVDYMESVRQAFLEQLPQSSPATAVINADQSAEQVDAEIQEALQQFCCRDLASELRSAGTA